MMTVGPIAILGVLSLIVTKTIDTLRNALDPKAHLSPAVWNATAFGLGVAITLIWHVNILASISHTATQGTAGQILTGLGLGAGSGGWHELLDALSGVAKKTSGKRRA